MSSDATGGYAELMPAHSTMLFPVPDAVPDEQAIFADPFAVSLHSITRHPPPPGGRALVWGAGSLGSCAIAILRALYPDVEVAVVARFDAQAALATALGAHKVVRLGEREEMLEDLAAGRAACCARRWRAWAACRCAIPAASTSPTTRWASPRRSRSRSAC